MLYQLLQKRRETELQIINSFETAAGKRERERSNWYQKFSNKLFHNNYFIKKNVTSYTPRTIFQDYIHCNEFGFVLANSAGFCVPGHFFSHNRLFEWEFWCDKYSFCPKKWRKVPKTKLSTISIGWEIQLLKWYIQ